MGEVEPTRTAAEDVGRRFELEDDQASGVATHHVESGACLLPLRESKPEGAATK
jgi:hypothetical protein